MAHGFRQRSAAALVAAAVTIVCARAATAQQSEQPRVNLDARISVDFLKRVQAYLEVKRKIEATLPALPASPTPAQAETHRTALARQIAQTRWKAKQGDIFTKETRAYFRRQLARALAGPEGAAIRASMREEDPGRFLLRINGRYPDDVPFVTMEPQILAALPKLPEELEYRFLGGRLILLDVPAQLVADYIEEALPK
jgi:hypothetical protein